MKCWKPSVFFTFYIFGRHLESIVLYCVGKFKMNKAVFRAGETIICLLRREKLDACWSKKSPHAQTA